MGATTEPGTALDHAVHEPDPTVPELGVHDAEVSTMAAAPTTRVGNGDGPGSGRLAAGLTAIGYGLFALQQPGTLQQLAEVAGTVEATGRVAPARTSGQVAPDNPQIRPSRAATQPDDSPGTPGPAEPSPDAGPAPARAAGTQEPTHEHSPSRVAPGTPEDPTRARTGDGPHQQNT